MKIYTKENLSKEIDPYNFAAISALEEIGNKQPSELEIQRVMKVLKRACHHLKHAK